MPRKHLPWIKLWFEMLGDPKMTRLTLAERGCWHEILLLAGQSPARGKLMLTETEPMTLEDIARALSLTPDEFPVMESCVAKLTKLNSLTWNEHNCLEVINFKKRQEVYESDFTDYHKGDDDKLRINSELTPDKVLKEVEEEVDVEVEEDTTPKGGRKKRPAPQTDPRVKEVFDEVKKYLGYPEKTGGKNPIPNYGKEGQNIKKMLTRGFTCKEILDCWRGKVSQRGGDFISMQWVNEDIGKKGGVDGADKRHTAQGKPEGKWDKSKPLRP